MDARSKWTLTADVVVVGGGAAGVAAAVTAARQGMRVVLLEKYGFCGGGAVAGLSGTICGLYEASDSRSAAPRQVVFGFADEFVKLLESRDGLAPAVRYGKTFTRVHEPLVWRDAADHVLREAGVQVLLHATVIEVLAEGSERIEGVVAYTKEGQVSIRANVTVDASGDADVVAMAGLASFVGRDGHVQNPTMIFRLQGVDVEKFFATYGHDTIMPPQVSQAIIEADAGGSYDLPRKKIWAFATTRPGELLCNCTRVIGTDGRELNTLFARDFTEAEMEGRLQLREYARFFKDKLAGCENSYVNDSAVQVGVRQTRQVQGRYVLSNTDVVQGTKFNDGIARSPWPIELHAGDKPRVEWLLDDCYEVPYRCFVPEQGSGLLVAGRCLSAEHEAVASARVTAQCFAYGQAIGLAAALATRDRILPAEIDGADVREELNKIGAEL